MFSIVELIVKLHEIIINYIVKHHPNIDKLLFYESEQYNIIKIVFCYFYGIFLAYIFWDFFILNIGFSTEFSYNLLALTTVILGVSCVVSRQARCICLLIWIGFLGKTGRSVLKAIVFAYIISGPIQNIALNSKEVVRVFSCSTVLTYNLTKTRFDLMTKPFHNAIMGMKENVSHVKDTFKSIEDVVQPIVDEIENDDDDNNKIASNEHKVPERQANNISIQPPNDHLESSKNYQEKYINKLHNRCEVQIKRGAEKCRQAFSKAYDKCHDKLPFIVNKILCWPMKITFVCNIAEGIGVGKGDKGPCDPTNVIDKKLGENYADLKLTDEQLLGNFSEVHINYTKVNPKTIPGVKSAEETAKATIQDFEKQKSAFDYYMAFAKRILGFVFIKIIFGSISYNSKYLGNIDYDNCYITKYFKKIELRRKKNGNHVLLPLKKAEKSIIIDPLSTKRGKQEQRLMFLHLVKLIIEIITATFFVFLDNIFYQALDLIAKHAKIDYVQEGIHDVNITIEGTGIIAKLVRSAIKGFNTHEKINVISSNEICLPKPKKLSIWHLFKIYGTYSSILYLIYNEMYIHRLRHVFCSYFYPKREKKRVLYLYNKLLKRRRGLFKSMLITVKEKLKKGTYIKNDGFFMEKRLNNPKYFGWLKMFACARQKCAICDEPEPTKKKHLNEFVICLTPNCYFAYCYECWQDIGEKCLACEIKIENNKKTYIDNNASDNDYGNSDYFESDIEY